MARKIYIYLKYILLFAKYSFIRSASFKFDFLARFLMDFFYYAVALAVILIIYSKTENINGWEKPHFLLLLAVFFTIDSFQMIFLSTNAWNINHLINTGKLDYFIIKPISSFFFTFFQTVESSSLINFLFVIPFCCYVFYLNNFTVPDFFMFIFVSVLGAIVFFCLRILIAIANFWSESPFGLERVWLSLTDFMKLPKDFIPSTLRFIFLTFLPVLFVASIPAEILITFSIELILSLIFITIILIHITRKAWELGLLRYTSASS